MMTNYKKEISELIYKNGKDIVIDGFETKIMEACWSYIYLSRTGKIFERYYEKNKLINNELSEYEIKRLFNFLIDNKEIKNEIR